MSSKYAFKNHSNPRWVTSFIGILHAKEMENEDIG